MVKKKKQNLDSEEKYIFIKINKGNESNYFTNKMFNYINYWSDKTNGPRCEDNKYFRA